MCLILFAYKTSADYPLILAANRDEFYERPAQSAHFWQEACDYSSGNSQLKLYAGKDLAAGGTWLGTTNAGRFAAITNYRDGRIQQSADTTSATLSRGLLPTKFLMEAKTAPDFIDLLKKTGECYRGFNLLFGDGESLHYASNRVPAKQGGYTVEVKTLSPGVYGLCNHLIDTPWPKVVLGKKLFEQHLAQPNHSSLQQILTNEDRPKDKDLPETHVGLEIERLVSTIFIRSEGYGTRSATSLIINNAGLASIEEANYNSHGKRADTNRIEFNASGWEG